MSKLAPDDVGNEKRVEGYMQAAQQHAAICRMMKSCRKHLKEIHKLLPVCEATVDQMGLPYANGPTREDLV